MKYEIFEGNMERLEKKLFRIYNKCKAYGCDFHYEVVGETFRELKDSKNNPYLARFIVIDAEGKAIVNNWEFVASVEHTEKGNIFTSITGIEIPDRYYTSKPVCEHCNTNRYRKYTYIVRNNETGEFKQVGKSCLKDFTHGMSAEAIAQYISLFDTLIAGESPEPGVSVEHYLAKEEYLKYVAETIHHFGYVKTTDKDRESTASRAIDFYEAAHGHAVSREHLKYLQEQMDKLGFDTESPEISKQVKDALAWIENKQESNNYIHNLKTACALEYVTYKNFGLLASLFPAYNRDLKVKEEMLAMYSDESRSVYVGNVGDRITINVKSVKCMTSWENQYGISRIYKIIGHDGNVYIWKTGKTVDETFTEMSIVGTVKIHNEFRGVKRTELTRCKVTVLK